jgi:hypothetical protein
MDPLLGIRYGRVRIESITSATSIDQPRGGKVMRPTRIAKLLAVLLALGVVGYAATIPSGTPVTVRLSSEISSGTAQAGQSFEGSLAKDVVVNGKLLAKAGTPVRGKVTLAKSSGRLHAPGQLTLRLTSIGGEAVHTSAVHRQGKSHTKGNVEKIGGGAAAGAVIGAIAGGGKGAAIGTLAGGAAGTGVAAATGKEEAVFPAESVLTFTTTATSAARH